MVPRGRSQLVESLVWLVPFLCVKKREKKKREDEREIEMKEKIDERKDDFFSKKCLGTLKPAR